MELILPALCYEQFQEILNHNMNKKTKAQLSAGVPHKEKSSLAVCAEEYVSSFTFLKFLLTNVLNVHLFCPLGNWEKLLINV